MNPALTLGVSAAAAVLFVKSQTNRPPAPQNVGTACVSARAATTTAPQEVVTEPLALEEIDPYKWQSDLFSFSEDATNSFKGAPLNVFNPKTSQKVTEAMKQVQSKLTMDRGTNGSKNTGIHIPVVGRALTTQPPVPVTGECMFNMSDSYARALQTQQTDLVPTADNNWLGELLTIPESSEPTQES